MPRTQPAGMGDASCPGLTSGISYEHVRKMSGRAVYRTGMAVKSKTHARGEGSRCVDNRMEAGRMVQSQHCEERSGMSPAPTNEQWQRLFLLVFLRQNSYTSLYKLKVYSTMISSTPIVK